MGDKFTFSSAGLVHELEMAMDRIGGWNSALVKRLCEGDRLAHVREYVLGLAEIKPLERAKAVAAEVTGMKAYPADGEVFELFLDGDAPKNQPLEMVRRDGYSSDQWQYNGQRVTGHHTRRFKLVKIGYCRNWAEVLRKLGEHGRVPEGQWRNAFKNAFPTPDGKGPVGVADSSWVNPNGSANFPDVLMGGSSGFCWAEGDFSGSWRWLVGVE